MRVLIAEDDENIRKGLKEILETEGYEAIEAADGARALELYRATSPDFICLDIMMPEADGYEVCRKIRKENASIPIIFLSAKSEEIDKVIGLELGADDFVTKPFGVKEIVARIRAVTRRCMAVKKDEAASIPFHLLDLEVFPSELRAKRKEEVIELSLRDLKILELFHQNKGKALERFTIFRACWGAEHYPNSRTLDQHISQLRKRIEIDAKDPKIIKTVHGVGYRYEE